MKKDIDFFPVKNVQVVVVQSTEGWKVYLINRNNEKLEHVIITSRGYREQKKKCGRLQH